MSIADFFRGKRRQEDMHDAVINDRLVVGSTTVGHILEISNGYVVVFINGDGYRNVAMYVPTLEKIGEVLAAHKTKQKFLHEPEKAQFSLRGNHV
jgi:hypothetical protein